MLLLGISVVFVGCLIIKRMCYLWRQPEIKGELKYDVMLPLGCSVIILGMIAMQAGGHRFLPIVAITSVVITLVSFSTPWGKPVKRLTGKYHNEALKGKVARQLRARFPCATEADVNNAIHEAIRIPGKVAGIVPPENAGGKDNAQT